MPKKDFYVEVPAEDAPDEMAYVEVDETDEDGALVAAKTSASHGGKKHTAAADKEN